MSKAEDKAVELMDKAAGAVEQFAGKLEALAKQHGAEVWDLTLTAARIDAAHNVVIGMLAAAAAFTCCGFAFRFWKKHKEKPYDYFDMPAVGLGVIGVFFCIVAAIGLTDIWAWAGVFEPKLWLAKKVLGL